MISKNINHYTPINPLLFNTSGSGNILKFSNFIEFGANPINFIDPLGLCSESTKPAPDGHNVYASEDGVYKGDKWNDPNDKDMGLGYYQSYIGKDGSWNNNGHMDPDSIPENLKDGTEFKEGDYMGRIANPTNGNSTGPHLHKEKFSAKNEDGVRERIDPGETNRLGEAGRETAGYPNYPDGSYHGGRDDAPKPEFKVIPEE